jgi:hypothetical protein
MPPRAAGGHRPPRVRHHRRPGRHPLRYFLASAVPSRAQVIQEAAGGWSAFIPGLPVAADGATFDDAITDMIGALRDYAHDWQDHLLHAPNHRDNWGLVQLISLSDDEQLREWLAGPAR